MADIDLPKNKKISILSNVDPGEGQSVSEYKWSLDGVQIATTQDIELDTSKHTTGNHSLQLYARNSCGNSNTITKIINIVEVNNMEKSVNYTQDQPVVQVAIVLDFVGTTEITVTDQLNRPVPGATIDHDGTPTGLTTDTDGKASIPNVPYGPHTVKATK